MIEKVRFGLHFESRKIKIVFGGYASLFLRSLIG